MIEFEEPPLEIGITHYMKLAHLWKQCSSCVGFCVEMGHSFFTSGYKEVDEIILKELTAKAPTGVSPRVIPAYSTLFWFAREVGLNFWIQIFKTCFADSQDSRS